MEKLDVTDEKSEIKTKLSKFPRGVPFILSNVFFEKYSGRGTAGIILLFLNQKLKFDRNTSTAIYHANELIGLVMPIFGAIIAETYWGLYKTIKWMTLVFAVGCLFVSVCAIEVLNLPVFLTFIGFLVILIGSGCMKANLNTFGANQYKLPEQEKQLKLYFSLQAFFYEFGTLLGMFLVPILRESVKCFGSDDCYSLAFGVSGVVMITAFLAFLCGRSFYKKSKPSGNIVVKVTRCVVNAITEKFRRHKTDPKHHWLDYAVEKYGVKLVSDTKTVVNILKLYIPMPIYWAVYLMQGSRWVFQATRMNGDLGFYTVPADQIYTLNPLFVILTLPLCDYVFYPLLERIKLGSLLQKMTIGILLGVISISIAAFIEKKIETESISILWLIPQYLIFAISDNLFFISHLRFVYTEASANMKSVMTSSVYVVMASGDLIVIFVSGLKIFESQFIEFLFFAGTLLGSMILFGVLAARYKPSDKEAIEEEQEDVDFGESVILMEEIVK